MTVSVLVTRVTQPLVVLVAAFLMVLTMSLGSSNSNGAAMAFVVPSHTIPRRTTATTRGRVVVSATTQEETAKAMQEYMAKTHEEKLKTEAILREKEKQIEELKKQLDGGSTSSALAPAPVAPSGSDAVTQLAAYQKFMADYIVRSQEEKLKAVREAESRVAKKYEEKLLLLSESTPATVSPVASAPASAPTTLLPSSESSSLYMSRNARVVAASKAGKGRWGDQEVKRVSEIAASSPVVPAAKKAAAAAPAAPAQPVIRPEDIPEEVIAADHGLRADGGVGGLTLAERVLLGSTASSPPANVAISVTDTPLYNIRNARVVASAKAGKSRWGPMEVEKVAEFASSAPPLAAGATAPAAAAAGATLADRVNLGAQLLA